MKLPIFPEFKQLELEDKPLIENFTSHYLPFSDYNFTSLWVWNTCGQTLITTLNRNLVIQFPDYISPQILFISFMGRNNLLNTIGELLEYTASRPHTVPFLKLVPACFEINDKIGKTYSFEEDRDNFDYIFTTEQLINLSGNRNSRNRNMVNHFKKNYNPVVKELDPENALNRHDMEHLFWLWGKQRQIIQEDLMNEMLALKRLIWTGFSAEVKIVGVYSNFQLVAFAIIEVLLGEYAIVHFQKANVQFKGGFQYIIREVAKSASSYGKIYLNYEQDLGLSGLRKAKLSFRPLYFLRKYKIARNKPGTSK